MWSNEALVLVLSYDVISGEILAQTQCVVPTRLFVEEKDECEPLVWILDHYQLECVWLLIEAVNQIGHITQHD